MTQVMAPQETDLRRGSAPVTVKIGEIRNFSGSMHECRTVICPEAEGGFSAYALRLVGVASQGETEEEAVENLKDAFRETLLAYDDLGMNIPWGEVEIARTPDTTDRWVLVDV